MQCINVYAIFTVAVYVQPKLIKPPENVTARENTTGNFFCIFNSSTKKYFTNLKWLINGTHIINTLDQRYQITERNVSSTDKIYLGLNISKVSRNDHGNYSCYCSYNKTMLNEINVNKSYVAQGSALLTVKTTSKCI